MALYLGSVKRNIYVEGKVYSLLPPILNSVVEGVTLTTSDNYILKDSNGLYLTTKESE